MTQLQIGKVIAGELVTEKFGAIEEVEAFLNGWDYSEPLTDWHEMDDEEANPSEQYYNVAVDRLGHEDLAEEDSYSVEVSHHQYFCTWILEGAYEQIIDHTELMELVGDKI
jgi:hypothetical protein